MTIQREHVLSLAGRIENEMHAIGGDDPFSEWLLGTYIPSLHAPGELPDPAGVYEKARDAWVLHGPEDDAPKRVLELLYEIDLALEFTYELLRHGFFESEMRSDKGFKTTMGRAFTQKFEHAKTRFVAFQLELRHAYKRKRPVTLIFDWVLQKDDGTFVHQEMEPITILETWDSSWIAQTWGSTEPGTLEKGKYRGIARVHRRIFAQGEFEIA